MTQACKEHLDTDEVKGQANIYLPTYAYLHTYLHIHTCLSTYLHTYPQIHTYLLYLHT